MLVNLQVVMAIKSTVPSAARVLAVTHVSTVDLMSTTACGLIAITARITASIDWVLK